MGSLFPRSGLVVNCRIVGAVLLFGLLVTAGCSKGKAQSYVSGQVLLDGEPLGVGSVLMIDEAGQTANAPIEAGGKYSLKCSPGKYRVAVSPPAPVDPLAAKAAGKPVPEPTKIPKSYQEVKTSGLLADIAAGSNTYDFKLETKGKK